MTITAQELVRREVHYCVSALVSTLAANYGGQLHAEVDRDMLELAEQAFELACPINDWEEAARQEGWHENPNGNTNWIWKDELGETAAESWQEACELDNLEPYQWEVFEHWIVSDWLADKLEAEGEKIDRDFAGLTVWARTTTGQAIYADSVMERIAASLNYHVDGTASDGTFQGDGQNAPFRIFDIEKQDHLPESFNTRAEAEKALSQLSER